MEATVTTPNLERRKAVSSIGMIIILVSFAMLFAALLLGYAVFRLTNEVWPPMGMEMVPIALPLLSTLVIAASSVTYINFEKNYSLGNQSTVKISYFLTLILGIAFMAVQFQLWDQMADMGLYVSAGIFPSLLYTLTWVHAAHIVMAILALLALLPAVFKEHTDTKIIWIQNIGKFWHFLGIIWLIMFAVIFAF